MKTMSNSILPGTGWDSAVMGRCAGREEAVVSRGAGQRQRSARAPWGRAWFLLGLVWQTFDAPLYALSGHTKE